jgi:hypothetical protein
MYKMFAFVFAVLMTATTFAQTRILTADITEMNHGGWGTVVNVGANVGDVITIDVTCDHSDPLGRGVCLFSTPVVQSCNGFEGNPPHPMVPDQLVQSHEPPSSCQAPVAFVLSYSVFRHQTYTASSPSTGDQFVETQYWWIGTGVHYWLHVTNWELQ